MGYTVRQARRLAGRTQAYMADKLGVHRTTYIRLEEHPDSITLGQARVISRVTGVPFRDIFFDREST